MVDGGVENINKAVTKLVTDGLMKLILAQTDLSYSNSMIEAFWRVLKNQWIYLNHLDTLSTLRKLIEFYVNEHNAVLPHSAFDGPPRTRCISGQEDISKNNSDLPD